MYISVQVTGAEFRNYFLIPNHCEFCGGMQFQ